jgi:ATP synthase I subunit
MQRDRGVILSGAAFQAERRACPERSRRDLPLNRRRAPAKRHRPEFSNIFRQPCLPLLCRICPMESEPSKTETVEAAPTSAKAEKFYSGALDRIRHFMMALALLLTLAAWWRFGIRAALGFVCGCAIAYLNFYWLKRVISALADRATGTATRQSGEGVVARFLLRYILMAVAAYAILAVFPKSLNGLLVGLFLPVAGIACEAVYEVYAALVRGV